MRVYYAGLANPPEEFLRRKYDALRRAGVDVVIARDFFEAVPFPRPDVVHFEWNGGAIDFLERGELWEIPTIVSCRGTQIRVRPHVSAGYAEQVRETFRRATLVHCVCETVRDEACALGLDRKKSVVILPAVDVDEFRPAPPRARTPPLRLLAVGALIWIKGYETMLQMMRQLIDGGLDCHLEIIGAGGERARVLYTIDDLGLARAVTLRGAVPPDGVREAIARSDVFLHASLSEGISNAVLEAMASGLPVVTTDSGGMREAVTDAHDGLVVGVRDPRGAAEAVLRLARDPALAATLGTNARRTVESRFRLDAQIARWLEVYAQVAARPRATVRA
jgi:glycosyltransferase involved in cell wall biosynthesis